MNKCLCFPMILLALVVQIGSAAADDSRRPNVLFLAVDDLNDWTTFLGGHPQVKTPNLERLARRGTMFTRAYCSAPACNPSRASLLTGVRPSTSGVYNNYQPWRPAMPDAVTLPQHFMAAGYTVEGAGKIFHGRFREPESWQVYVPHSADPKPDKSERPLNGMPKAGHFDWGPVPVDDEAMGDTKNADFGIEFLGRKQEKPFFLAVGMFRPHLPWYVPKKYFDLYPIDQIVLPEVKEDDLDDVPPAGRAMAKPEGDHARVLAHDQWKRAVQGYLASISFADAQIGRVLDALDRSPYADNTIICLWGDHGWHLGEKQHWRKFALWEEATRVPLVFVVPEVTRPGSRCERTVSLLDIYPTLADLCRLPVGEHLEGKSLKPLLENPAAAWDRPVVTTHGRNNHAVRSERWRYIHYSDGTAELYDHENDPREWTNLAKRPESAGVIEQLKAWLPRVNAPNASP